jgi:hypothetical protein
MHLLPRQEINHPHHPMQMAYRHLGQGTISAKQVLPQPLERTQLLRMHTQHTGIFFYNYHLFLQLMLLLQGGIWL